MCAYTYIQYQYKYGILFICIRGKEAVQYAILTYYMQGWGFFQFVKDIVHFHVTYFRLLRIFYNLLKLYRGFAKIKHIRRKQRWGPVGEKDMRNKLEMEFERKKLENRKKMRKSKKGKQAVISCNKLWLPCILGLHVLS